MKRYETKWWIATFPEDWLVTDTRSWTHFTLPGGCVIRVAVTGELCEHAPQERVESWSKSFLDKSVGRQEIHCNGFDGIVLAVKHTPEAPIVYRAFVEKGKYLTFLVLEGELKSLSNPVAEIETLLKGMTLKETEAFS